MVKKEIRRGGRKFREWLETFIEKNNLRNNDVGELFGVNNSLIGHYLKSTRLPTYNTLQRIKIATGVDMNTLFEKVYIDEETDHTANPFDNDNLSPNKEE